MVAKCKRPQADREGRRCFTSEGDRAAELSNFIFALVPKKFRGQVCALFERAQYFLIERPLSRSEYLEAKRCYARLAECVYAIYDAPKKHDENVVLDMALAELAHSGISRQGVRSSKHSKRLLKPRVAKFWSTNSTERFKLFGLTNDLAPDMGRVWVPKQVVSLGGAAATAVRLVWLGNRQARPAYARSLKRVPIDELALWLADKCESVPKALALTNAEEASEAALEERFSSSRAPRQSKSLISLGKSCMKLDPHTTRRLPRKERTQK